MLSLNYITGEFSDGDKMTIRLDSPNGFTEIDGIVFTSGLAVHKDQNFKNTWRIVHLYTGRSIGALCSTKQDAVMLVEKIQELGLYPLSFYVDFWSDDYSLIRHLELIKENAIFALVGAKKVKKVWSRYGIIYFSKWLNKAVGRSYDKRDTIRVTDRFPNRDPWRVTSY